MTEPQNVLAERIEAALRDMPYLTNLPPSIERLAGHLAAALVRTPETLAVRMDERRALSPVGDSQDRLSLTREPPIRVELWRDAYARIAAQYATLLERFDLAEDATADDILDAAGLAASPAPDPGAGLREAAKRYMNHVAAIGCDHDGAGGGTHTGCPEALSLRAALAPSAEPPETV